MAMAESAAPDGVTRVRRRSLSLRPDVSAAIAFQVILAVALIVFVVWIVDNTIDQSPPRQHRLGLRHSCGSAPASTSSQSAGLLLERARPTAARSLSASSIRFSSPSIGIVLASIIGFLLGVARLSGNWLLAKVATVYVETFRNIPLLLQLLFWYKAVLSVLPGPRQGLVLPFGANLSNRGLIVPRPVFGDRASPDPARNR